MAIPVVDGQHKGQRFTYSIVYDVADSDATSIDTVRLGIQIVESTDGAVSGSLIKAKKLKEHIHSKKINRSQKWIEKLKKQIY